MAPPLIRRREKRVRIAGVENDIGDAGVLADGEDALPGLAAIGGLVQAAVAAGAP
jgi:hypothetical protein